MLDEVIIKQRVDYLIETFETENPFRLAKALDIIVLEVPLVGIFGFCHEILGESVIYIKEDLNEYEKTLVCAHELGHALLHKGTNALYLHDMNQLTSVYELEANLFACFLLKRSLNFNEEHPLLDWNISNYAMLRRARIDPTYQYESTVEELSDAIVKRNENYNKNIIES